MSKRSTTTAPGRRRLHGQALVETLVFALALLPMLVGLVFVTRYQNIRQAAVAASRSAAFDCTVRPDRCGSAADRALLVGEGWQRHLSDGRTVLRSLGTIADVPPQRNTFWVDRHQQSLVEGMEAVGVEVARETGDTTDKVGDAVLGLPGHFGLRLSDDLVTAEVRAGVSRGRRLADWLVRPQGIELALVGRTAILVDNWNASEGRGGAARSVETRIARGSEPPVPGFTAAVDGGYLPIRTLITSPLLEPFEPNGQRFDYHRWDVDRVPADRLPEPQ
jgi:hypothetical protein